MRRSTITTNGTYSQTVRARPRADVDALGRASSGGHRVTTAPNARSQYDRPYIAYSDDQYDRRYIDHRGMQYSIDPPPPPPPCRYARATPLWEKQIALPESSQNFCVNWATLGPERNGTKWRNAVVSVFVSNERRSE